MDRAQPPDPRGGSRGGRVLGRIAGIPIEVHASWLVLTAVVVALYSPVLRQAIPGLGGWAYALALAFCLLLAVSVLLHELAHAAAARRVGWPVHRIVLSLTGGHTSFDAPRPTWSASAVVSAAGPLANLALAAVGFAALRVVPAQLGGLGERATWTLLSLVATANLFVGLFNLLPGLPLDGGRILEALVWGATGRQRRGTLTAAWAGRLTVGGLVLAILLSGAWRSALGLLIAAFIAWALLRGAQDAIRRVRADDAMRGLRAGDLARPALAVPEATSLDRVADLAAQAVEAAGDDPYVVGLAAGGTPVGVLDPRSLDRVPAHARPGVPLSAVLHPLGPMAVVPDGLQGSALVQRAARARTPAVIVTDDRGAVTGVVTARQINDLLAAAGLIRSEGGPR